MSTGQSGNDINTLTALRKVIGKTPPAIDLKVIDHLDESALRWLEVSPLMFAAFGDAATISVTLGGGVRGFASGDAKMLRVPANALDNPALARPGLGFGSLFLIPGVGETVRVNGRVDDVIDGEIRIIVEECYVHCAKALIRSDFWSAEPLEDNFSEAEAFVEASRFMALATVDVAGRADVSPKGDPSGSLARLHGDDLWFADRPGNRRVDSFRNIIAQPRIAAVLIVPGSHQVVTVSGSARLTADDAARTPFTVRDRKPALVIEIEDTALNLRKSTALERTKPWPPAARPEGIDPARMLVAHVKANKGKGLGAKLTGAAISIPGLIEKGLEKDYKSNLY